MPLGTNEGIIVGRADGIFDVGDMDGKLVVGTEVGPTDVVAVGLREGVLVGAVVGRLVGNPEGETDGLYDGI